MKPISILLLAILMASCQKESVIWLNETDISGMTTGTGYAMPSPTSQLLTNLYPLPEILLNKASELMPSVHLCST